jgi:outer-membrane receptor for ferric coprogen and ferric-rhodotorulic acid
MLAAGLAWGFFRGGPAHGREPVIYQLHIGSQSLDGALQDFARQSGVQIIFFSRITEGLRAPALDGPYTIDTAMAALLSGSTLTYRIVNAKTVEIRTPPPVRHKPDKSAIPETSGDSTGRKKQAAGAGKWASTSGVMDEVVINGTAEGLVATRIATPLQAIPQTVAIISREQLRAQNNTDLADALAYATGITEVRYSSVGREFYSRGFKVTSFHVDGGAALFNVQGIAQANTNPVVTPLFLSPPDLSGYERIEVLRGVDALFAGNGNPGGTVSMVRKRPRKSYELMLDAWSGSWDNTRLEADITGPIALNGALRARADALYSSRSYFYDTASFDRKRIFAAVEYDLTPATVITGGGSHQWDDSLPFVGGLPRNYDGSDPHLSRATALTFDWARFRTRMQETYLQLQHDFESDWRLKLGATGWHGTVEYAYGLFDSAIDPLTRSLNRSPRVEYTTRPNSQHQVAFDVTLTGKLEWFGRRQELAIGADYTRSRTNWASGFFLAGGSWVTDIHAYEAAGFSDPRLNRGPYLLTDSNATEYRGGAFASLRAYLTDHWSVVGGARVSSDHTRSDIRAELGGLSANAHGSFGNSGVVTPFAGVMYHISDQYSLYASYADIYRTAGVRADGTGLDPSIGTDVEAGIKGAWRDGALTGALVFYKVRQSDIPISALSSAAAAWPVGDHKSKGIDAEVGGRLRPGWLIGAGYTFNTNVSAAGGELSSSTPRHLLKLWTSAQLPGRLSRLTVGGNVHAQSSNSRSGTYCPQTDAFGFCTAAEQSFEAKQDPYVVVSLRAGLEIDTHWRAALTVNNVFDEVYYETIGTAEINNWFGEPRGLLLRFDGSF